jgi:hypothetical protein
MKTIIVGIACGVSAAIIRLLPPPHWGFSWGNRVTKPNVVVFWILLFLAVILLISGWRNAVRLGIPNKVE